MRPSEALALHRDEALAIIAKYPVSNPRIFGSVARGEDVVGSDIDILVHPHENVSYFELGRLANELERLLNCTVDLGEDDCIKPHASASILNDIVAL